MRTLRGLDNPKPVDAEFFPIRVAFDILLTGTWTKVRIFKLRHFIAPFSSIANNLASFLRPVSAVALFHHIVSSRQIIPGHLFRSRYAGSIQRA